MQISIHNQVESFPCFHEVMNIQTIRALTVCVDCSSPVVADDRWQEHDSVRMKYEIRSAIFNKWQKPVVPFPRLRNWRFEYYSDKIQGHAIG